MNRRDDILKRLMARTIVAFRGYHTPCFEWTGPTSGKGRGGGYGRMTLNDTTCATHKVAWTNENGYIPPGKQLDHKCENRRCWRPDHLDLVTHKRNQKLRAERKKLCALHSPSPGLLRVEPELALGLQLAFTLPSRLEALSLDPH